MGNIEGIPIYEDKYMEDDVVLKGYKGNINQYYIIANPKTASIMYKTYLIKIRKEKLDKLNNI